MITVTVTNRTWTGWPVETLTGEFPSVGELKREVHRVCRVVSDLQLLVHDGKLMHDDMSHPSLYGVVDGASIDLHVQVPPYKNVTLTVEFLGNPFPMAVDSCYPIKHLKNAINYCIGLPLHRQQLTYMGAFMRDDDLVCDYVISEAPTEAVQLTELPRDEQRLFEVEVLNMHTGESEIMMVDPLDTMNTVAAEMRLRGLNQDNYFFLALHGRVLYGRTTLEENGIREGRSSLEMIYLLPQ